MKTHALFLIVAVFISNYASAQQLPLFSQYRENQSILNPAALNIDYIRNDYNFSAGVSRRDQWGAAKLKLDKGDTYDFGPGTTIGRVEWIFPEDRFFVGGHVIEDRAGAINLLGAYVRAGYFILDPASAPIALIGSISGGFNSFKLDLTESRIYDYNVQYSVVAGQEDFKTDYIDYSIGFFSWGEVLSGALEGDIIYGGVSLPQMRGLPLSNPGATLRADSVVNLVRLNVVAGIYKYLAAETFLEGSINFNTLLKGKSPFTMTGNLRYHYRDWGWFGAGAKFPISSTKLKDVVSNGLPRDLHEYQVSTILLDLGFNIGKNMREVWDKQNIKLGLGYEFPIGGLLKELGNTIEFNLTYTLDTRGGRR